MHNQSMRILFVLPLWQFGELVSSHLLWYAKEETMLFAWLDEMLCFSYCCWFVALSLGAWCIPWQTPGLRVLENCHSSSTWWITPGLWSWHCDFYLVSRILSGNCSAELSISLSYWQGSQFLIGFVERHLQAYFLTTASFASWLPMVRNWCQNSILQRHCGDWNVIQTLFC